MAEHELIQQQRQVLQELHRMVSERKQAEAEAVAQFEREKQAADTKRKNQQAHADAQLEKFDGIFSHIEDQLKQFGMGRKVHRIADVADSTVECAGARQALKDCIAAVSDVLEHMNNRPKRPDWLKRKDGKETGIGGDIIIILLLLYLGGFVSFIGAAIGDSVGAVCFGSGIIVILFPFVTFYIPYWSWRSQIDADVLTRTYGDARHFHACLTAEAVATFEHQVAEAQTRREQAMAQVEHRFQEKINELTPVFDSLAVQADTLSPTWTNEQWDTWIPPTDFSLLPIRFGQLQIVSHPQQPLLPAFFSFPSDRSLLLEVTDAGKSAATQALQALFLRLLATVPPGKLRFTFIDPVGLGQNVAPFMHLNDYDDALVTGKAWTEPAHIEQRLADLSEHTENVIQKYLRNQYASIEEYNAQAGEIAEPYRVLVVFDFPVNFTETAARRLVSIAQHGPRCGVYAIVLVDTQKPLPYGFDMADLEQGTVVIEQATTSSAGGGNHFVWHDDDFKDCQLVLDHAPDTSVFEHIVSQVGEQAVLASKVEVPFERIVPPADRWWQQKSIEHIRVSLGPAGANKAQYLELGQSTAQHALVVGKTGSGKSTLLHVLITSLSLTYSPEEVELYLIDFKKGVEFKTYATHRLPHARVIAIESEREFGLSVLEGLDAELKRRGDLFRAAGVDHLAAYRQKNDQVLPRILLLVDEFQEFFTEDDPIASQAAQILDRLVRQGRAFGIHILLGSQTLAGAYALTRATIDQMAVRIALQCSEADSRLILADDNPAARLLSRPGEAIYNAANGMVEGNNRFQVAWLTSEQQEYYLVQVRKLAASADHQRSQIVFEGNAPVTVEQNLLLHDLLEDSTPAATPRSAQAWLGEPIAIADPVAASLRRQSGSNLLLVGQNSEAALAMMAIALISLVAHRGASVQDAKNPVSVLDLSMSDMPHADFFQQMVERMPDLITVGRRRHLPEMIAAVFDEIQRRLADEDGVQPPMYLCIYGLQRARDLRQEDTFGFTPYGEEPAAPSPAQQLSTILREGPELGVHTLIWCDTMTNLNRAVDRRALREFAIRVALQMSAEDSINLIDTPAASKLGSYRALLYDEDAGRLDKFRPYALPTVSWLTWVGERLEKNT